jgi:DinB family protein
MRASRVRDIDPPMTDLDALRYPVGRFERLTNVPLDTATRRAHIDMLEQTPARIRALVGGLSEAQLDTPYRPGGWTIRQVIHHVPDSHMNAYIRMKMAVTEELPAIKTYQEQLWAELPDEKSGPPEMSLVLLEALHVRWVAFLRVLPERDFGRAYTHPESGAMTVDEALAMYAWHCRHHTGHIEAALASQAA